MSLTGIRAEIRALRAELRAHATQKLGEVFGWRLSSTGTALGTGDRITLSDATPSQTQTVRRIEQWGLRGVPMNKLRMLTLRLGDTVIWAIGIGGSKAYGPTDLNPGETVLYSKKIVKGVWLDVDGNNILAAADGQTVQIAGDSEFMLLPSKLLGDLKTLCTALAGASPIVVGSTGVPNTTLTGPANAILTAIAGGTYLSTKAKNG